MAEQLLSVVPEYMGQPAPALQLLGDPSRCMMRFSTQVRIWVSEANEGAHNVAAELLDFIKGSTDGSAHMVSLGTAPMALTQLPSVAGVAPTSGKEEVCIMLLYLNAQTFSTTSSTLAHEVKQVLTEGRRIVLVHDNSAEHGVEFDVIYRNTPQELIEDKLYDPIAIPLHSGKAERAVSMRLLALALGARPQVGLVGEPQNGASHAMAAVRHVPVLVRKWLACCGMPRIRSVSARVSGRKSLRDPHGAMILTEATCRSDLDAVDTGTGVALELQEPWQPPYRQLSQ